MYFEDAQSLFVEKSSAILKPEREKDNTILERISIYVDLNYVPTKKTMNREIDGLSAITG